MVNAALEGLKGLKSIEEVAKASRQECYRD